MRVVVVQGVLPHYRVPFFEALADRVDTLTVAHSGTPGTSGPPARGFSETLLPRGSAGGVYVQRGLRRVAEQADVLVLMFDLRWPMNVVETVRSARSRRVLLWGHGLGSRRALRPLRLAWIGRADGVILYHRVQADQLIELGVPAEKVFVAPNAMAAPVVPLVSGPRDSILFVGRLEARKRVDVLIEAFGRLKGTAARPELRLDIVGDGSERSALEARVRTLGLAESVHFHGTVHDQTRVGDFFNRAILYASPGWTGLGLLHAFGHGVPAVIGAGIPHAPEAQDLVAGVNGLCAEPEPEDFARALGEIAGNPELREELGRAAAEFVQSRRRIEDMVDGFSKALHPGGGS